MFRMMFEVYGHLPADVGRMTLPQLKMLLAPVAKPRTPKMIPMEKARAAGWLG